MADDLSELEARLFEWIRQSDFHTMPWSTSKAAKAFKVKKDEIYEAVAALTKKVPDRIQVFYKEGTQKLGEDTLLVFKKTFPTMNKNLLQSGNV